MANSLNEVTLIGNVGKDPEVRSMQSGDRVANLSIATSESWKDKNSGERKEATEWHNIVVFNSGLVKLIEGYIKKGTKLYIKGQLKTRSWEQDGQKKYMTEVVLRPYNGEIIILTPKSDNGARQSSAPAAQGQAQIATQAASFNDDLEDEIPF